MIRYQGLTEQASAGANLSPRRKVYARVLLRFLNADKWRHHGEQIRFNANTYERVHEETELDIFAANQALDDLYALGVVHIEMQGATQCVTPMAATIEQAAAPSACTAQPVARRRTI